MSDLENAGANARRASGGGGGGRKVAVAKAATARPRDSNPYGNLSLDSSFESNADSRRGSLAASSRRSSLRLSTGSESGSILASLTEEDDPSFVISASSAATSGEAVSIPDRRKTFDAASTSPAAKARQPRRNTLGPVATSATSSSSSSAVAAAPSAAAAADFAGDEQEETDEDEEEDEDMLMQGAADTSDLIKFSPSPAPSTSASGASKRNGSFERSSDKKRPSGARKSPGSSVASAGGSGKRGGVQEDADATSTTNISTSTATTLDGLFIAAEGGENRRATADPAELATLLACLEDSTATGQGEDEVSMSLSTSTASAKSTVKSAASRRSSTSSSRRSSRGKSAEREELDEEQQEQMVFVAESVAEEADYPTGWGEGTADGDDTTTSSIGGILADRRETVDPDDMKALLRDLQNEEEDDDEEEEEEEEEQQQQAAPEEDVVMSGEEQQAAAVFEQEERVESTEREEEANDSAVDMSTVSSLSAHSGRSLRSNKSAASSRSSARSKAPVVPSSAASKSSGRGAKKNSNVEASSALEGNRRETADPADMAELMQGLLEEQEAEARAAGGRDGAGGSSKGRRMSRGARGRESIDTVMLVQSVADMLDDLENNNGQEGVNESVISSFSVQSSASKSGGSRRSSNSSRRSSKSNGRRTTADTMDLAEMAAEFGSSPSPAAGGQGQDSMSMQQDEEANDDTMATMDLMASVRRTLDEDGLAGGGGEEMNISVAASSAAGGEDEDSFAQEEGSMINSSLCSLGGLLKRGDVSFTNSSPIPAPRSPTATMSSVQRGSVLKSCLSSRKPPASARKAVVFGSPQAAEYVIGSKTSAMTPLNREAAKLLYSMVGSAPAQAEDAAGADGEDEDAVTADNSRILDEWDRLTNDSERGAGSDEDEPPLPPTPIFTDGNETSLTSSNSSKSGRRRRSSVQPALDISDEIEQQQHDGIMDTSNGSDATGTIQLPSDLADLIRQSNKEGGAVGGGGVASDVDVSMQSAISATEHTQELEMDLQSVLRHVDYASHSIIVSEDVDTSTTSASSRGIDSSLNNSNRSSRTTSSSSSSNQSLGNVLGLNPLSSFKGQGSSSSSTSGSGTNTSADSPLSEMDSAESEVSFRMDVNNSGGRKSSVGGGAGARGVSFSSTTVGGDAETSGFGHTEQLEPRLGDLLDASIASPRRGKRVATPAAKGIAADDEDDDDDEEEEDDHTQRLEANLSAMLKEHASPELSVIMSTEPEDGEEVEEEDDMAVEGEEGGGVVVSTGSAFNSTRSANSSRVTAAMSDMHDQSADGSIIFAGGDADVSMNNTSVSHAGTHEAQAMLQRLRALNAGARQNSLSQCGTPMAASSRLSIGIKRNSLLTSATRARDAASKKGRVGASADSASKAAAASAAAMATAPTSSAKNASSITPVLAAAATGGVEDVSITACPPLSSLLQSSNLVEPLDITTPSFSLTSALAYAAENSVQGVRQVVAEEMSGLLKEAVKEARTVPADMAALEGAWASAAAEAKAIVGASLSSSEDSEAVLQNLGAQCQSLSVKKWGAWESKLLEMGTEALAIRAAEVQARSAAVKAELAQLSAYDAELHDATLIEKRKNDLADIQQQVRAARLKLEESKNTLLALGEETSALLDAHKERIVAMAGGEEGEAGGAAGASSLEQVIYARMNEQQEAIEKARESLRKEQQSIAAVNRLNYCRTNVYTTSSIEVEVLLSCNIRAVIAFHLAPSASTPNTPSSSSKAAKSPSASSSSSSSSASSSTPSTPSRGGKKFPRFTITNTDVQIIKTHNHFASSSFASSEREDALALAFYEQVLRADDIHAPLSEHVLSSLAHPSDIPSLLRNVSGYVLALRRVSTWMQPFEEGGWAWNMSSEDGTIAATYTNSRMQANAAARNSSTAVSECEGVVVLSLPLRAVVAGDVGALTPTCLTWAQGGADVSEGAVKAVLSSLKQSNGSPFGSFPSFGLKKAIEGVLQHI